MSTRRPSRSSRRGSNQPPGRTRSRTGPPRDTVAPGGVADPVVAGLGPVGGDLVDATVERIVPGGDGLAHTGGLTLFLPVTAPGDRIRARITRRRGRVTWGEVVEIEEAGPDRIEPPYSALTACGLDLQHLTYSAQLTVKGEIVRDCLRRIAGITPPDDIPVIASPNEWGYRVVAEWAYDPASRAIGYRRQNSHQVIDLEMDPTVEPALQTVLDALRERLAKGTLPPGIDEYRAVAGDDAVGLVPPLGGDFAAELTRKVAGEHYRYDASCFFQANASILPALVDEALRYAQPGADGDIAPTQGDGPGFAIDLFCGVGLFTVPLARRFRRVVGVEGHGEAARWAKRNLRDAGVGHAKVEIGRVDAWLTKKAAALSPAAFLLLDPPRTGVGAEIVASILTLAPHRIAYVSCDPATQARDLKGLIAGGYALERVVALDMFPQTHHVESIAHLVRAS